jgi:hypothetical protein
MAILPAIAGPLGMLLTVGQIGLGVAGSLIGAASEAEAAKQAEAYAKRNKEIAEENAQRTLTLAQDEQYDLDIAAKEMMGEQVAVQSASGLKLSSGSFIQTRKTAKALARIDALNVHEAAQIRAKAYRTEGDSYAAEAEAARRAQGNAMLGGFLGAAGSIIGGASNLLKVGPGTQRPRTMTIPSSVLLS